MFILFYQIWDLIHVIIPPNVEDLSFLYTLNFGQHSTSFSNISLRDLFKFAKRWWLASFHNITLNLHHSLTTEGYVFILRSSSYNIVRQSCLMTLHLQIRYWLQRHLASVNFLQTRYKVLTLTGGNYMPKISWSKCVPKVQSNQKLFRCTWCNW